MGGGKVYNRESTGDYLEFQHSSDEEIVVEAKNGNCRAQDYIILNTTNYLSV